MLIMADLIIHDLFFILNKKFIKIIFVLVTINTINIINLNFCASNHSNNDKYLNKFGPQIRISRSLPSKESVIRDSGQNHQNSQTSSSSQTSTSSSNYSNSTDQFDNFFTQLYSSKGEEMSKEELEQMKAWLSDGEEFFSKDNEQSFDNKNSNDNNNDDKEEEQENNNEHNKAYLRNGHAEALKSENKNQLKHAATSQHHHTGSVPSSKSSTHTVNIALDDEEDNENANTNDNGGASSEHEDDQSPSGTTKTPPCAQYGRFYCSYKEDYPIKVVTEVTKYFKWPLEKLFRELRNQIMPSLATDNHGGLVCDSITRIIRPGWSKNTNGRWLVVINTEYYQQYVTEVICRHGTGSYCNFIPPCYHASCKQRYNTQKLLVIDPWNPYKGPFLSEFLFPSCCICFVPAGYSSDTSSSNTIKEKIISTSTSIPSAIPAM